MATLALVAATVDDRGGWADVAPVLNYTPAGEHYVLAVMFAMPDSTW